MDSFEANKIFGAVLGAVFVLFGGSILAEGIFHSEKPEKPGYLIAAVEETAGGEAAAEAPASQPIAVLLASANVESGAAQFKKCGACHSAEKGGPNKVGPYLWGVVGRPIASVSDFSYSAALKEFSKGGSVNWDFEHLNGFIHDPKGYVPGTAMGYAGLKDDAARADLLLYLRSLSDDPVPLPEPTAVEAAPAGAETAAQPAATTAAAGGQAPATTEGAGAATPAAAGVAAPQASAPAGVETAALPASADPAAGEKIFRKCAACHSFEEGGDNGVGPALHSVFGRPVASHEGYDYSPAMTEYAEGGAVAWDYAHLSAFLENPKGVVPGTKMGFAGLKDPGDRDNLIAYLASANAR